MVHSKPDSRNTFDYIKITKIKKKESGESCIRLNKIRLGVVLSKLLLGVFTNNSQYLTTWCFLDLRGHSLRTSVPNLGLVNEKAPNFAKNHDQSSFHFQIFDQISEVQTVWLKTVLTWCLDQIIIVITEL